MDSASDSVSKRQKRGSMKHGSRSRIELNPSVEKNDDLESDTSSKLFRRSYDGRNNVIRRKPVNMKKLISAKGSTTSKYNKSSIAELETQTSINQIDTLAFSHHPFANKNRNVND
jgi:hypothetical protein